MPHRNVLSRCFFLLGLATLLQLSEAIHAQPNEAALEDSATQPTTPSAEAEPNDRSGDEPNGEPLPAKIEPGPWTLLPRVGDYRRAALHVDPVEAAIARGEWQTPVIGGTVRAANGSEVAWRGDEGERSGDLAGGYAYAEFESPAAGVMLLEAVGCAAVCLNGEWLPGDPYGVGWFRPPARIKKGSNWMVVHLARPDATARFVLPAEPVLLLAEQATLPDLVVGTRTDLVGSVPILNAAGKPVVGASITVRWGDADADVARLRRIESRIITPVTFKIPKPPEDLAAGESRDLTVSLVTIKQGVVTPIAATTLSLKVVESGAPRTQTFLSDVDGSVQPYAVMPAAKNVAQPGVLLALHDAGQSAIACRDEYTPLPETHVVAPLGRGRWAFDWEDWSRLDALEALDDFQRRQREAGLPIDTDRVSLIGHGMGGHGALSIATLTPERFAAVGIVDGWISFYTQGGAVAPTPTASPLAKVLARQAASNDPLRAIENLAAMGVSVRHTGKNGVSPSESRYLRQRLGDFHQDFTYQEAEDAASAEKDRDQQIEWLAARRRRDLANAEKLSFATPDIGAASTLGWATIQAAQHQGEIARVRLDRDAKTGEVTGSTDNVSRLRLSFEDHPAKKSSSPIKVRLDGSLIAYSPRRRGETFTVARDVEGDWLAINDTSKDDSPIRGFFKGPERAGGFKSVFCCRPMLVYGTRGTKEARQWAAAKARYDAQLFLYRGAGRLEVRPDSSVGTNPRRGILDPSRSVIVYGNANTNSAWRLIDLFERFRRRERTFGVTNGTATVGPRPEAGDDLSVLAIRPRFGNERACIAAVGGTGPIGMRMTTRLRYFWSGLAYPDYLLFGPAALAPAEESEPEADVRAAGYFDTDWSLDDGEIVWRDLAI